MPGGCLPILSEDLCYRASLETNLFFSGSVGPSVPFHGETPKGASPCRAISQSRDGSSVSEKPRESAQTVDACSSLYSTNGNWGHGLPRETSP